MMYGMSAVEHYEKGMEYFGDDHLEEAIEELRMAVETEPDYGDALHALAMCYYHQRDYDRALEYGHRFREAEPSNALAYTSLSMFYNAKGMIKEAEDMGAKARTVEGGSGDGVSLS